MSKIKFEDLILCENDDYIVINKPPLLSTLEDRNEDVNVLSLARTYCKDAQVCHRLDKETSGALCIAKNAEAYRHLSIQFEKRSVEKIYHAIVDGIHEFRNQTVKMSIFKLSNGTVRIDRKGKEAVTHFNTLRAYQLHTLIECQPVTGRMHQIRVHLAHINASISGDEQYGGKPFYLSQIKKKFNLKKYTEEQPLIKRLALHAYKLSFSLLNDEKTTVEAPYPKDFKVLLTQLDKNS